MKEAMVTRTIITTEVIVLGVNEETGESENRGFNIPGKVEGSAKVSAKEKALKLANKANTDKLFHPAVVVDLVSHEKIYGVPISKFMEIARIVERPASQTKKSETFSQPDK